MSADVIELLESSGDEQDDGKDAAPFGAGGGRKRRRSHEEAVVLEIGDSDDDDDDGGGKATPTRPHRADYGGAARLDDSIEIWDVPQDDAGYPTASAAGATSAAAAGTSPAADDSDGSSFIELLSPPGKPAAAAATSSASASASAAAAASNVASAAAAATAPADTPLNRIVDVFPDICPDHAIAMLRNAGINPTRIYAADVTPAEDNMVSIALHNLVEGGSYPKNERFASAAGMAGGNTSTARNGGLFVVKAAKRKAAYMHDYSSPSSFVPSDVYKNEVANCLMVAFCFLSREGARRHLALCKGRYSLCYTKICDALADREGFAFGDYSNKKQKAAGAAASAESDLDPIAEEKLHKRVRAVRAGCALSPAEVGRLRIPPPHGFTATLRRSRRNYRPAEATDTVLLDEVRYASDKLAERAEVVRMAAERQRIHDESEKAGTTLECQCCYGDYAFEELVACRDEGHLFCMDCVRRYAEEQVFGLGDLGGGGGKKKSDGDSKPDSNELLCMHPDGCRSGFQYDLLKKALPPKVMQKYDELQATRAMEIAGVEGLCRCPKCDFQAVLSPSEMVFSCPIETCRFESCKLCGEPSHIPLKCEEVEKQNETDGRKKVEEAMTAARVRTCPKPGCGKRFYKVDGCNKMTCSCQTWSCYICRALIPKSVGYKHFCQKPHCDHKNCNLCPLYSNAAEDDLRAAKEAGEKAANEVLQESHAKKGEDDENESAKKGGKEVRVDVNALLKNADVPSLGNGQRAQAPLPPGMPVAAVRAAGYPAPPALLPPGLAAIPPHAAYPVHGLPAGFPLNFHMPMFGPPPPERERRGRRRRR